MINSQPKVEEVMERIREAMKANKATGLQQTASGSTSGSEIASDSVFNHLDVELRQNNLAWNINTEYPINSHRKRLGYFIVLGKKLVRKFLRWYITPPLDQQREFNGSVSRSLNDLRNIVHNQSQSLQKALAEIESLEALAKSENLKALYKVENLEALLHSVNTLAHERTKVDLESELTTIADRQRRLERKINKGLHIEPGVRTVERLVQEDKVENLDIDYFLFEQRFRGKREDIKERQKVYIDYFRGKTNVLDIGCGRGEFVELLMENGVGVQGIDLNEDMVGYCQDNGLPVLQMDLFKYLDGLEDNSLDGIFAAQVIEHLEPKSLIHLSQLCYKKLKPSGTLVFETINPGNVQAICTWFYLDPSHIRPVSPELIKFITEAEGFKFKDILYLSPVKPPLSVTLPMKADSETKELNEWLAGVDNLVFGPQDYALIVIK